MDRNRQVLIVLGSPRERGNSASLADRVAEGVQSAGGVWERVFLHGLRISPCNACDRCQADLRRFCVIEDDMQDLYPRILRAHALLIAGPVYWFTMSAQTKLFMDRCYALLGPGGSLLEGKRIGLALAYGDTDPFTSGAVNALRAFQDAFRYTGSILAGSVYGSASEPGEIERDQQLMELARRLGRDLVE
ncbi:MAG: flavodoxin family protein [Spirochaetota bacterium]